MQNFVHYLLHSNFVFKRSIKRVSIRIKIHFKMNFDLLNITILKSMHFDTLINILCNSKEASGPWQLHRFCHFCFSLQQLLHGQGWSLLSLQIAFNIRTFKRITILSQMQCKNISCFKISLKKRKQTLYLSLHSVF